MSGIFFYKTYNFVSFNRVSMSTLSSLRGFNTMEDEQTRVSPKHLTFATAVTISSAIAAKFRFFVTKLLSKLLTY